MFLPTPNRAMASSSQQTDLFSGASSVSRHRVVRLFQPPVTQWEGFVAGELRPIAVEDTGQLSTSPPRRGWHVQVNFPMPLL